VSPCHSTRTRRTSKDDDNEDSLDELLDKSYFTPDEYDENDSGPLVWFANQVKSDYEFAKSLYVTSYFVVLMIITQELLRMQLYGDGYIPFTRLGANTGDLFEGNSTDFLSPAIEVIQACIGHEKWDTKNETIY
jgi:hypothetical protein